MVTFQPKTIPAPLGILYLAGALRRAGHDVEVIDCHDVTSWDADKRELIIHREKLTKCDIVGISATTANVHWGKQLAKVWPAKFKVLGGSHATYILRGPHEQFKRPSYFEGFNFIIIEEAEETFVQFCDGFDKGDVSQTPNLCWFNALGMLQRNPHAGLPDVEKLAPPAFDLWPSQFAGGGLSANGYDRKLNLNEAMTASMYNSRGCLEAGTQITLANGTLKSIEDLQEDEEVQCFDLNTKKLASAPIKVTWEREANDLWEIELENGVILHITGEHPVWTKEGWHIVEKVYDGQEVLFSMRDRIPCLSFANTSENLFSQMQSRTVNGNTYEESSGDDQGRKSKILRSSSDSVYRDSKSYFRRKARRQKSSETPGSSSEDCKYSENKVWSYSISSNQKALASWNNAFAMAKNWWYRNSAEQVGIASNTDTKREFNSIQICRRWQLLDWALHLRYAPQSGLCGFKIKKSYTSSRRVLASGERCSSRSFRLSKLRMESLRNLGCRIEYEEQNNSSKQAEVIWTRVIRRTFVGHSSVYNITIHPYHNYFANGVLVHNCPYGCRFCADARTKIRNESFDQVEGQIKHLASLGVSAIRIQDDVLTIKADRCKRIADILDNYNMKWRGNTRVNLTDPNLFKYMAKRGCIELGFGCEHGSAKMLKLMDKGTTPEKNTEGIKMCQEAGMVAKAFIILGFPGETLETIEEMRQWVIKAKPSAVTFSLFQPYPGSDVWNNPQNYGVTLPNNAFDKFWIYGLEGTEDELVLSLPTITKGELLRARREIGAFIDSNIGHRDRRRVDSQFHGEPAMM